MLRLDKCITRDILTQGSVAILFPSSVTGYINGDSFLVTLQSFLLKTEVSVRYKPFLDL